jgi:hypothetical protein
MPGKPLPLTGLWGVIRSEDENLSKKTKKAAA